MVNIIFNYNSIIRVFSFLNSYCDIVPIPIFKNDLSFK